MPARHHPIAQPAHASKAQALDFLARHLPNDIAVHSNPWMHERNGRVHENDAVVMAPDVGVWIVEYKSYHGCITGNEHDRYIGGGTIKCPRRRTTRPPRRWRARSCGRSMPGAGRGSMTWSLRRPPASSTCQGNRRANAPEAAPPSSSR